MKSSYGIILLLHGVYCYQYLLCDLHMLGSFDRFITAFQNARDTCQFFVKHVYLEYALTIDSKAFFQTGLAFKVLAVAFTILHHLKACKVLFGSPFVGTIKDCIFLTFILKGTTETFEGKESFA